MSTINLKEKTNNTLTKEANKLLNALKPISKKHEDWLYLDPDPFLDALEYCNFPQKNIKALHTQEKQPYVRIHNAQMTHVCSKEVLDLYTQSDQLLFKPNLKRFSFIESMQLVKKSPMHVISIKKSCKDPIYIDLSATQVSHSLLQISVAKGIKATIYIELASEDVFMPTVFFRLEEEASLECVVLSQQNKGPINTTFRVELMDKAYFNQVVLVANQDIFRLDSKIASFGESTESHLNGLALLEKQEKVSFNTEVYLTKEHGESHQLFKTILKDKSQADYNGLVYVEPDAQQTNSDQMNRNMILVAGPRAYSRPQLRIYADDVRCTHGATTGQLDPEEVLYLQSRGLEEAVAKRLLIHAFLGEVLDRINHTALKDKLNKKIHPLIDAFLAQENEDNIIR